MVLGKAGWVWPPATLAPGLLRILIGLSAALPAVESIQAHVAPLSQQTKMVQQSSTQQNMFCVCVVRAVNVCEPFHLTNIYYIDCSRETMLHNVACMFMCSVEFIMNDGFPFQKHSTTAV